MSSFYVFDSIWGQKSPQFDFQINGFMYLCQKSLELTSIYLKPILTLLAFIYLPLKNEKNAFLCIENKLRTEKEKT